MGRFSIRKKSESNGSSGSNMDEFDFTDFNAASGSSQQSSLSSQSAINSRRNSTTTTTAGNSTNNYIPPVPLLPQQQPNLYRNPSVNRHYINQPMVLMTPPILSKKSSVSSHGRPPPQQGGGDEQPPIFDGFDGVHVNEEDFNQPNPYLQDIEQAVIEEDEYNNVRGSHADECENAQQRPELPNDDVVQCTPVTSSKQQGHIPNTTSCTTKISPSHHHRPLPEPPMSAEESLLSDIVDGYQQEYELDPQEENFGPHPNDDDEDSVDDHKNFQENSQHQHHKSDSVDEITKEEFENSFTKDEPVTLYHPKPRRVISHNFDEATEAAAAAAAAAATDKPAAVDGGVADDNELSEFNLSFDKEDAAGELNLNFTPLHTPKPSAGQISLDPASSGYHSRNSSSKIGRHSRHTSRASMGSMNSMLSRKSILDPHPTDFGITPPPPVVEGEDHEPMVYYPAPIPVQLRLPPLLSKRNKQPQSQSPGQYQEPQEKQSRRDSAHFNPRRASSILQPPTWNVSNQAERESVMSMGQHYPVHSRQSVYSSMNGSIMDESAVYDDDSEMARSASPALSIDSGRATIESDEDDENRRNLDQEMGDTNPLPKKDKKKDKKKKKSKRKSLFKKKKPDYLDEDSSDDGIDDEDDMEAAATKNNDHLAFTHYNASAVENTAANNFALGSGAIQSTQPTSLIEELELRKAGRKQRSKLVLNESKNDLDDMENNKRMSKHPLDIRQSRSLMQLQQMANRDYDDQVQFSQMNRLSRANLLEQQQLQQQFFEPPPTDDNPNETLLARRQRLKAAKKLAAESAATDGETLGQRRARLKREKQEAQRQSQLMVA